MTKQKRQTRTARVRRSPKAAAAAPSTPPAKAEPDFRIAERVGALVAENTGLRELAADLSEQVRRLRGELDAVARALGNSSVRRGVPSSPTRRGPGRPHADAAILPAKPPAIPKKAKRARRKITDPVVLQRARDNLAKARQARAAKLAATKAS